MLLLFLSYKESAENLQVFSGLYSTKLFVGRAWAVLYILSHGKDLGSLTLPWVLSLCAVLEESGSTKVGRSATLQGSGIHKMWRAVDFHSQ